MASDGHHRFYQHMNSVGCNLKPHHQMPLTPTYCTFKSYQFIICQMWAALLCIVGDSLFSFCDHCLLMGSGVGECSTPSSFDSNRHSRTLPQRGTADSVVCQSASTRQWQKVGAATGLLQQLLLVGWGFGLGLYLSYATGLCFKPNHKCLFIYICMYTLISNAGHMLW